MTAIAQTQKTPSLGTWLRTAASITFMIALIFLAAGRIDNWQGWLYIALNTVIVSTNTYLLSKNPQLIEERLNPGQGMKTWDKVYFALTTPLFVAMLVIAPLDAGRFGWSGDLPLWLYLAAIPVYVVGQAIFIWAKVSNRFFSSVVRIQVERGHTVCREGPYRFVRHPGYAGSLLWLVAGPIVMGSLWGLAPSVLSALLLLVRTQLEDETLQKELPGYVEYVAQVKYRLLPGVW